MVLQKALEELEVEVHSSEGASLYLLDVEDEIRKEKFGYDVVFTEGQREEAKRVGQKVYYLGWGVHPDLIHTRKLEEEVHRELEAQGYVLFVSKLGQGYEQGVERYKRLGGTWEVRRVGFEYNIKEWGNASVIVIADTGNFGRERISVAQANRVSWLVPKRKKRDLEKGGTEYALDTGFGEELYLLETKRKNRKILEESGWLYYLQHGEWEMYKKKALAMLEDIENCHK